MERLGMFDFVGLFFNDPPILTIASGITTFH